MSKLVGRDDKDFLNIELSESGRSSRASFRRTNSRFRRNSGLGSGRDDNLDEESVLQWATIEKLPTFERIRSALFDEDDRNNVDGKTQRVIDVTKLGSMEKKMFTEKLLSHIEHDNLQLLRKIRKRIDSSGVKLPTVDVRYRNLSMEAKFEVVHGMPLPTLWNSFKSMLQQIPKWWIWCYYLVSTSWSLRGMLTSQYGDIEKKIQVLGETKTVAKFVVDFFGFHESGLALVAVVLALYPIVFAILFAYFIGKLNFQKR